MNLLEDIALWHSLRPRVAHRLPGRLRLRVPLLKNLPDDWLDLVTILERVLASPAGILDVSSDRRSGSLLVAYEPSAVSEDEVLDYLRSILELVRRNRDHLAGMNNGRATRVAERLQTWVMEQTRHKPFIDPGADVPDEVWT